MRFSFALLSASEYIETAQIAKHLLSILFDFLFFENVIPDVHVERKTLECIHHWHQ